MDPNPPRSPNLEKGKDYQDAMGRWEHQQDGRTGSPTLFSHRDINSVTHGPIPFMKNPETSSEVPNTQMSTKAAVSKLEGK